MIAASASTADRIVTFLFIFATFPPVKPDRDGINFYCHEASAQEGKGALQKSNAPE